MRTSRSCLNTDPYFGLLLRVMHTESSNSPQIVLCIVPFFPHLHQSSYGCPCPIKGSEHSYFQLFWQLAHSSSLLGSVVIFGSTGRRASSPQCRASLFFSMELDSVNMIVCLMKKHAQSVGSWMGLLSGLSQAGIATITYARAPSTWQAYPLKVESVPWVVFFLLRRPPEMPNQCCPTPPCKCMLLL